MTIKKTVITGDLELSDDKVGGFHLPKFISPYDNYALCQTLLHAYDNQMMNGKKVKITIEYEVD